MNEPTKLAKTSRAYNKDHENKAYNDKKKTNNTCRIPMYSNLILPFETLGLSTRSLLQGVQFLFDVFLTCSRGNYHQRSRRFCRVLTVEDGLKCPCWIPWSNSAMSCAGEACLVLPEHFEETFLSKKLSWTCLFPQPSVFFRWARSQFSCLSCYKAKCSIQWSISYIIIWLLSFFILE